MYTASYWLVGGWYPNIEHRLLTLNFLWFSILKRFKDNQGCIDISWYKDQKTRSGAGVSNIHFFICFFVFHPYYFGTIPQFDQHILNHWVEKKHHPKWARSLKPSPSPKMCLPPKPPPCLYGWPLMGEETEAARIKKLMKIRPLLKHIVWKVT